MKSWSLKAKIYFVLSIFIVASVTISVMGIQKLKEIKIALDGIVKGPATRTALTYEIRSHFYIQMINQKNFILAETLEEMKLHGERLAETDKHIKEVYPKLYDILVEAGRKDMRNFLGMYEKWWDLTNSIRDLALQGKDKEAFILSMGEGRKVRIEIETLLGNIISRNIGFTKELTDKADSDYETAKTVLIVTSVMSILIGLALASIILRALGVSIDQVISSLIDNSNQVSGASQQIASSSEELSQAATEQASSLQETSSSIEEMNSMVKKNAENAKRTSDLAVDSSSSATRGQVVVKHMIKAIGDISESNSTIMHQVEESNQQISEIVKVISEIGEKTRVINDIVFQTKLLSFNASVEAARAGEHGKGFSVVAEEVGNLAQMSGNAATEISSMLEGSIRKVESIVNDTKQKVSALMIEGKEKIESGTKVANDCGKVLEEIVSNIGKVNEMATEIANACHEQSLGVQEITKAMHQLDQVTQSNAASSEETASAAEELSSQSDALRSVVNLLVQAIHGDRVTDSRTIQNSTQKISNREASNIHPIKKPKIETMVQKKIPLKKASGFEGSVPSEHDPRFEDV